MYIIYIIFYIPRKMKNEKKKIGVACESLGSHNNEIVKISAVHITFKEHKA